MELVIEELSLTYSRRVQALREINLALKPGVFGLLGPNGAGKSTLMKILATLLHPSSGRVRIGPYSLPREQHRVRRILGYLPQVYGLFDNLTAVEFLEYMALMKGMEDNATRRREIDRLLEAVRLHDYRHRRIKTLSGGMRQRLALAQALINSPPFLILDEPTAGLDPEERLRMRNLIGSLAGERLVILSTHIVPDITAVCTQVGVLHRGRLIFHGEPSALANLADGLVWELIHHDLDYKPQSGEVVVSSRRENGHLRLRLLAAGPPAAGAAKVKPNPEDGYMALLSGLAERGQDQ